MIMCPRTDKSKGDGRTLADRLRERMVARGENPNEAARRTGVGYATLHGLLEGTRSNPTLDVLERLAAGYGVTVGWLVDGDGAEPPQTTITPDDVRKVRRALADALGTIDRWAPATAAAEAPIPSERERSNAEVAARRLAAMESKKPQAAPSNPTPESTPEKKAGPRGRSRNRESRD